jgi:S1-C subfamily serine protease
MAETNKKQAGQTSVLTLTVTVVLTVAIAVLASVLFLRSRNSASEGAAPQQSAQAPPAFNPKPSGAQQLAQELSTEDLFRLASPSVVLIEVFGDSGERTGTASGFIASENGAIITNYHVVRGARSANVRLQDGSTMPVQGVLGFDPYRDVAIIKVGNLGAKSLTLDSDHVQVGDKVTAIGSPLALQNTISDGLVSGIRNGLIQTSTPISSGSSGGPFFNTHGEVVGVAVAGITAGGTTLAENLNFAVPINWAKTYLRSSEITSLDDLAKQNTVLKEVLDSTISVPAHEQRVVPIVVDRNRMSNPELVGSFSSSGGAGGNVRVAVLDQNAVIYDSGRTTNGRIQLPLRAGIYRLVIDNRGSVLFPRNVTCDLKLHYVK